MNFTFALLPLIYFLGTQARSSLIVSKANVGRNVVYESQLSSLSHSLKALKSRIKLFPFHVQPSITNYAFISKH